MRRTFELGGIIVPVQAAGDVNMAWEDLGGFTWPPLRMQDGTGLVQQHWRKLRVRVSGSGIVPAAFAGLDITATHTLKSPSTRAVHGGTNVITVPAARRTDSGYTPRGFAVVDGGYVATPLAMAGDVATLTAVPGAAGYGVLYWPQLTVFASFSHDTAAASSRHDWVIDAEEA